MLGFLIPELFFSKHISLIKNLVPVSRIINKARYSQTLDVLYTLNKYKKHNFRFISYTMHLLYRIGIMFFPRAEMH